MYMKVDIVAQCKQLLSLVNNVNIELTGIFKTLISDSFTEFYS